jgi:hypothetical protein
MKGGIFDAHIKILGWSLDLTVSVSTGPSTLNNFGQASGRPFMDVERYVSDNAQKVCSEISKGRRAVLTLGIVFRAIEQDHCRLCSSLG